MKIIRRDTISDLILSYWADGDVTIVYDHDEQHSESVVTISAKDRTAVAEALAPNVFAAARAVTAFQEALRAKRLLDVAPVWIRDELAPLIDALKEALG